MSGLKKSLLFLSFTIGFVAADVNVGTGTADTATELQTLLRKVIFANYDKAVIPDNVAVKFGFALVRFDAHPEVDHFEAYGWLRYGWMDKRLSWNNETYGVDVLRVPVNEIWTPDITLYNSFLPHETLKCAPTLALVYPNGEVLWVPPCSFQSLCDMENLREHPEAKQKCFLKFGSWTYDGFKLQMELYNNITSVDVSDMWASPNWKLIGNNATLNVKTYSCCPEPYADVKFELEFEWKHQKPGKPVEVASHAHDLHANHDHTHNQAK